MEESAKANGHAHEGAEVKRSGHVSGSPSVADASSAKSAPQDGRRFLSIGIKETMFSVGAVVALWFSFTWGQLLYDIVDERQKRRPDYDYPKFSDLQITFQAMAALCFLRVVLTRTVFYWLGNYIIDPRFQNKDRADRVSKFATVLFKFCYFAVYTALGFYLLLDKEWTMPALGGTGNIVNMFMGYPFQKQFSYIREYYLVSLAYHAHSLLFHVVSPWRNDFVEMLLHHIVAVTLIVFSYMLNFVRGGSLVMLLHDMADIPAYLVKSTVDTKYKYVTLSIYVSLLLVWGYARLYVLPFEITIPVVFSFHQEIHQALKHDGDFLPFFAFMLITLQVLHVLWYGLFLQMGLNFLKTGKTEDTQQRVGKAAQAKKQS